MSLGPTIDAITTGAPLSAFADDPLVRDVSRAVAADARRRGVQSGAQSDPPGVVYTPRPLADALVELALSDGPLPGRVLDPACGRGALLVAVLRRHPTAEARLRAISGLRGIDVDPTAIVFARAALALAVAELDPGRLGAAIDAALQCDLLVQDALTGPVGEPVDLVVANPPYEDASAMVRRSPAWRRDVADRYATASGNWDLFCPFVERCLAASRAGGTVALLVPDKLAQAPYAAAARALLQPTLRTVRHHAAGAVPASIRVLTVVAGGGPREPGDGAPWSLDTPERCVDSDDPCRVLADLASVHNAATVSEAYRIREALVECQDPGPGDLRLLTTGAIDPFAAHWGDRAQRYLRATWDHPVLPSGALPDLERRLARLRCPKVILAGLARRLEAVADAEGTLLPSKSTLAIIPTDDLDVHALAALLNAPSTTRRWRSAASGLALSGGYLRVTKASLESLPVPLLDDAAWTALADLGRRGAAGEDVEAVIEAVIGA